MALMGFGDLDDMFGGVDRMMNNMMRNIFGSMPDPFDMMDNMLMGSNMGPGLGRLRANNLLARPSQMQSLMMGNIPTNSSFSYSSVTTMSTDPHGRPLVYEATASSRCGPDGVKETRSTVRDSASGLQEMSIGHHINERSHVVKRSRNTYTGEEEHNDEFVNLEEEEAPSFENEWQNRMQSHSRAYNSYHRALPRAPQQQHQERLALLPPPESCTSTTSSDSTSHHIPSQNHRASPGLSSRRARVANASSPLVTKGKAAHKSKKQKKTKSENLFPHVYLCHKG